MNDDTVSHTATSSVDFGETFDTGLLNAGDSYKFDTNKLDLGTYEYMCIVHPWMVSTIIIEESCTITIVNKSIILSDYRISKN